MLVNQGSVSNSHAGIPLNIFCFGCALFDGDPNEPPGKIPAHKSVNSYSIKTEVFLGWQLNYVAHL